MLMFLREELTSLPKPQGWLARRFARLVDPQPKGALSVGPERGAKRISSPRVELGTFR